MTEQTEDPRDQATLLRRLEALLGEESVSADYVRLWIGLLQAQTDTLTALVDSQPQPARSSGARQGPILKPGTVRFDPVLIRRLFDAIRTVSESYGGTVGELARLCSAMDRDPALLETLVRSAAFASGEQSLEQLGRRLDVSAALLLFWGRLLAAPFVTHAAGQLEPSAARVGSHGTCPVCGSPPGLASLQAETGKRLLHCSLCGHSWPFDRLACPFCNSRQGAVITRITVKDEGARWIETCRSCKHYLKTVDLRQLPESQEFYPLAEEVASLHLDLLAEQEGCLAKPPYAAMR